MNKQIHSFRTIILTAILSILPTSVLAASDENHLFVAADSSHAEAGVTGYIVSKPDDLLAAEDGEYSLFVQVLGTPAVASSVNIVTTNADETELKFTVRMGRSGETLQIEFNHSADLIEVISSQGEPIGFIDFSDAATGGEVLHAGLDLLDASPAWSIFRIVINDADLRGAIHEVVAEGGSGSIITDCASACASEPAYQMPEDCEGATDQYHCCLIEASYDHCRRACDCELEYPKWWQYVAKANCLGNARLAHYHDGLSCAAVYLLPFIN